MPRIAVTGAGGTLGKAVVLESKDRGYDVVAFYHSAPLSVPSVQIEPLDLTDTAAIRETLSRIRPDIVLHAAAEVRVDWCEDHPDQAARINAYASGVLAEAASQSGASFLYVSTDSVFDGARGGYRETDATSPLNVYAQSKLRGEEAVFRALPEAIVARTNFYGWGSSRRSVLLDWIVRELAAGRELPGFADVIFCPSLASDVAEALLDLLERKVHGVFHVAGPKAISKYEFARNVAQVFGYDANLVKHAKLSDIVMRARRPLNTSLNIDKLRAALGREMPCIADGLSRLVKQRRGPNTEGQHDSGGMIATT